MIEHRIFLDDSNLNFPNDDINEMELIAGFNAPFRLHIGDRFPELESMSNDGIDDTWCFNIIYRVLEKHNKTIDYLEVTKFIIDDLCDGEIAVYVKMILKDIEDK